MMYSAVYSVGAVDISFVEFTPLVLFCLVLGGDGGFGGFGGFGRDLGALRVGP